GAHVISKGWQSYIAYGRWSGASKSHLVKIGSKLSVYWHGIYTRLTDRHGFASTNATKKFIREIEKIKPDIIQLHAIHGYYINIKILFKYLVKANIPVVWTFHDCWAFTGHCVHFENINCEKWKTQCHDCKELYGYPFSFHDSSQKNYQDKKTLFTSIANMTIVSVCNWMNEIVKKSFLNEKKLTVIKNGIDINVFKEVDSTNTKRKYQIPNDKYVIIAVASRWNKTKGLQDIFCIAKDLYPDMVLVLVGVTRQQVKYALPNIIAIGHTENVSELAALYSLADVLINPTYQDTYPSINLEAIACGTPVITYNTGGCAESINSETGIVIEQGNINEMLNAILLIKEKGKSSYSKACKNMAITNFDKNERYKDYFNLYNNIKSQLY
ncbi:MAG: glycosyltransferase, partial [Spirochaetaceae bacterium]|nr:glycosyltransferase [Spirochaetaceae bacterium]